MDYRELLAYKERAGVWAKGVLLDEGVIILDSETTGLDGRAQIIQLGITNVRGDVLMDTLLRPTVAIDPGAQRVHGISIEMLADAPTMDDLFDALMAILSAASRVIIYNAAYDMRLLRQTFRAFDLLEHRQELLDALTVECAMLRYAEWVGEWNEGKNSFKWQKLIGGDHSAVGDCRVTLSYLKTMADFVDSLYGPVSVSAAVKQSQLFCEIGDGA